MQTNKIQIILIIINHYINASLLYKMLPFLGIQLIFVAIAVLKIEIIHKSVDNVKELNGCYDYIVVGLGSAGCVVANRLAEDMKHTVLGLEAGIPQSAFFDIPVNDKLVFGSDYDWKFVTVPQKRMALYYPQQKLSVARGKVIGGTSVINGMLYNRGNKKGYDNWVETYGAIGWDYNNVLKYFIKSENNTDLSIVRDNPGYHGTGGPVGISSTNKSPILSELIRAMNSIGFKTVDINGAQQLGTTYTQKFTKNGLRSSTANAYLEPNPYPKKLFISINSFVTKIIIENRIAVGVEFVKHNKTYRAFARNEVIISAGAIQSPQILMLSGIGPKDHLNELGIPVVADLPVGHNLQDHTNINIVAILNDQNKAITPLSADLTITNLFQLYSNKSGDLTSEPIVLTYYNTKNNEDKSWPNTLITSYYARYLFGTQDYGVIVLQPRLQRPKTRGTIRLNSSDPFNQPLIDPNYLSDDRDLEDYIEVMKFGFYVLEETLLSKQVTIPLLPVPGCSYCSDGPIHECTQFIKCTIQQLGFSDCHFVGTCRMGSVNRTDVVVDERLRVKGIQNLRVIDCSIIPEIPNSNTNAAAIMIGEFGSDMIKDDNYGIFHRIL